MTEKDHFRSRKVQSTKGTDRNAGSGDDNETQMHRETEGVGEKKTK